MKSCTPASAAVGMSGKAGMRFSPVDRKPRSWFALTKGATTDAPSNIAARRPAMKSCMAGPLPRDGTCSIGGVAVGVPENSPPPRAQRPRGGAGALSRPAPPLLLGPGHELRHRLRRHGGVQAEDERGL